MSSVSLIGDLTTTAAAATKNAWSMAHGRPDCKRKPRKDSHTDTALSMHHRHNQYCNSNSRDADEERRKCPRGSGPINGPLFQGARIGGPLLSPYTSWFFNSFCGEFSPFCEKYFEERIFCRNFPRFLEKLFLQKNPKKKINFFLAKIHQNLLTKCKGV